MRLEQVMQRQVQTCTAADSLSDAAALLYANPCRCVPVTDADGHVAGIVTARDLCAALAGLRCSPADVPVSQAMTREVLTLAPHATIEDAHRAMAEHGVRRVPVVDSDGYLVGAVSLDHLAAEAEREWRFDNDIYRARQVAHTLAATFPPPSK